MSNIDFTKPVETVTGIPVQIISTSGREPYPVVGYIGEHSLATQEWTAGGLYNARESESDFNLRNKATWQLPAPPEGQQWHRVDGWTEEMLPAGYRPLLVGETGSYQYMLSHGKWKDGFGTEQAAWLSNDAFWRTDRPLPQQQQLPDPYAELKAAHAAGKVIQFNPGDSLGWRDQQCDFTAAPHCYRIKPEQQPQEPWAAEKAAFAAGETIQYSSDYRPTWTDVTDPFWVNPSCSSVNPRYRIKPKPQKVPLDPCDVPPGSVIRGAGEIHYEGWCMITSCSLTGIRIWRQFGGVAADQREITWQALMDAESQIWRPTDTEWQPCYKETQP
jgi:hypothetical protein